MNILPTKPLLIILVFWADPSGADSTTDMWGRPKFDSFTGLYISPNERGPRGNGSGGSDQENKETKTQKIFREALTSFIVNLDNQNRMILSEPANDQNVDAYQLFYQWIMGTGSSTRNFDENSTMGKQMLQAPEVINAIKKVIAKVRNDNFDGETFAHSLKKENPLKYIESFYLDADGRNPAQAFHGSFAGRVIVNEAFTGKSVSIMNLTIIITDNMTVTSGTRSSPFAGGYGPNPIAIYPKENPYGPREQFRTIKVNYNMRVTVQDGDIIKN